MLEQAEETIGEAVPVTLADGGYHTAANLAAGERRGDLFVMPERYHPGVRGPYFKDEFVYDAATDSYICPEGQRLPFRGLRRKNGNITGPFRVYRASRTVCWTCPAYGVLHQRRPYREGVVDWSFRCSTPPAPALDDHRESSGLVCPTKRADRAHLRHS